MNKANFKKIKKELAGHEKAIAKERDALANFISDAQDLLQCCEEALEALETAQASLSKFV